VTGPAGVELCDGDGLVAAVGDAGCETEGDGEIEAVGEIDGEGDPDGDIEAVDVTLGETATATGGKADPRQAASTSRPSNAGPATPSYRIPRR